MRRLDELLEKQEPAWPLVQEWLREATSKVEVLPPPADPVRAEALVATQVTTRSPMGAVIYETGGLLIDHGWVRVLGSGHPRLPRSLPEWNKGRTSLGGPNLPYYLLVADDVLGGFFALNGGQFEGKVGELWYAAPDTLEWEGLELTYTDFLQWCFAGDLARYYEGRRWPGWEEDVSRLPGNEGYSIVPPLWTEGPAIGERDRRAVPLAELYGLYVDEQGARE
jgi:hypothetical protein